MKPAITHRGFVKQIPNIALIPLLSSIRIRKKIEQDATTAIMPPAQAWKSGSGYLTEAQLRILQATPRKNPEQLFSFNNPAGPAFTEQLQQAQSTSSAAGAYFK